MLVLTRKVGDRIVIAGSVVLTVTQVKPGKVRLGIDAPTHMPVRREASLVRPPRRTRVAAVEAPK